MMNKKQKQLYDAFYESTEECEHLDRQTEILVGLSAAMAMNCQPCQRYYLMRAKKEGIKKEVLSEVLAKVMAVSAGQKRLQMDAILNSYNISFEED